MLHLYKDTDIFNFYVVELPWYFLYIRWGNVNYSQIDAILGENTIETSFASCPMGEEGLQCRRAEARRSVDCPQGNP